MGLVDLEWFKMPSLGHFFTDTCKGYSAPLLIIGPIRGSVCGNACLKAILI